MRSVTTLVRLERLERLAEGARDPPHLLARLDGLVDVALLGLARVEVAVDAVTHRHDEGGEGQVRVDGGVDRPVLEPARGADPQRGRAVLEAPVGEDGRPEAGVGEAPVGVHGRRGDRTQRRQVLEHAGDGAQASDLPGSRGLSVSGRNMFSSPCQSEMLWWQPLADTPMNGLGMKQGKAPSLPADLPADLTVGGQPVGGELGLVELEVELELAGRVLVVALDHVEAHLACRTR